MAPSTTKALTWRVSYIPAETTENQLIQFFIPSHRGRIKVGSLCPDVEGTTDLTATILFRPPPDAVDVIEPELDGDAPDGVEIDRDFEGFTPLFCPQTGTLVSADIIAVTGLAGHAYGSWEHAPGKMWLRDYITKTANSCRILTYGYDARIMGESASDMIIAELGDLFLENLINMRDEAKCDQRPIIFIGHSLGCLLIKKAMTAARFARDVNSSRLPVRAIIFLAAPHRGMDIGALRSIVKNEPPRRLVEELHPKSPTLVELDRGWPLVASDIEILTCFETRKTKQVVFDEETKTWTRSGEEILLLDPNSAKLGWLKERSIGASADHSSIAKMNKSQGGLYSSVKAAIKRAIVPTAQISRERYFNEGASTLRAQQAQEGFLTHDPRHRVDSPPTWGSPQESLASISPKAEIPASLTALSPENWTSSAGMLATDSWGGNQGLGFTQYPFVAVKDVDASEPANRLDSPVERPGLLVPAAISRCSSMTSLTGRSDATDAVFTASSPAQDAASLVSSHLLVRTTADRPRSVTSMKQVPGAPLDMPQLLVRAAADRPQRTASMTDLPAAQASNSQLQDPATGLTSVVERIDKPDADASRQVPDRAVTYPLPTHLRVQEPASRLQNEASTTELSAVKASDAPRATVDMPESDPTDQVPLQEAASPTSPHSIVQKPAGGSQNVASVTEPSSAHLSDVPVETSAIATSDTPDSGPTTHVPVQQEASPSSPQLLVRPSAHRPRNVAFLTELLAGRISDPSIETSVPATTPEDQSDDDAEATNQLSWRGTCRNCKRLVKAEDTFYGCNFCPVQDVICDQEPQSVRSCEVHAFQTVPMTKRRLFWHGDQPSSVEWINPDPIEGDSILIRELKTTNIVENTDFLKRLLADDQLSQQVDHAQRTPLHVAILLDLQVGIQLCLEYGADLCARDSSGLTPLGQAIMGNNEVAAAGILRCGTDPNSVEAEKYTALGLATSGYMPMVKLLLAAGAHVNLADDASRTPCWLAAWHGKFDICRLLISEQANVETSGGKRSSTPLQVASFFGHAKVVQLLTSSGANLEARDELGGTSLHIASRNGHSKAVKVLINSGANLEAKTQREETPLHPASMNGHLEVVKLLIASGANVEALSDLQGTPLMYSASAGRLEICKALVAASANVNHRIEGGWTVVYWAARKGYIDVVRYLLTQAGARAVPPSGLRRKWKNLDFDEAVASTTQMMILQLLREHQHR